MSKLLLKITNAPIDQFVHRTVSGISGREYLFMADTTLQAYVYEPAEEFEINDIFDLIALPNFPFRFAPVIVEGAGLSAKRTFPPVVTPDKYAEHSIEELLALAADCGFAPAERHDAAAVRAQLHAYFVGRAVGEKVASGAAEVSAPAPLPPSETVEV